MTKQDDKSPYTATLGDGEVVVDPSIDARFIRTYRCRVVGHDGMTGLARGASADEAAEIYAEGFRELSGEDYAGERVVATRLAANGELDMSETGEATI